MLTNHGVNYEECSKTELIKIINDRDASLMELFNTMGISDNDIEKCIKRS